MIKQRTVWTEILEVGIFVAQGRTTRVIITVKICIFERSNQKSHFSKTKIYFHKKSCIKIIRTYWATNIKVGLKTNFGRLAKISQICSMDTDILS